MPQKETRSQLSAHWGSGLTDRASLSTTFRHSGWAPLRRRVYEALFRTGRSASQLAEFRDCGSHAYVLQSVDNPNVYRVAGSSCRNRWCLPCATDRSRAIAVNVREHIAGKTCRFVTLTTRANGTSLADRLTHLYDAFARLRRRTWWKKRVTGGVAMLEIKWSDRSKDWHPHWHCILQGRYLPHRELKRYWRQATGDSDIVDIRLVREPKQAAGYVAKYASKPCNSTYSHDPDRLDEAIQALAGRKLLLTWGDWRGVTLVAPPDKTAWQHVASLDRVIAWAAAGDTDARHIINVLTDRDMTELYADAATRAPPPIGRTPSDVQLTWHGTWQRAGAYVTPSLP